MNNSSIDSVTEDLNNMAVVDNNDTTTLSICANCCKEEDDDNNLKFCGACKLVKYCSAACQTAHRSKHKRECKKRAAEIFDEKLFQDHPPNEECPICMLPLPFMNESPSIFKLCCGKLICKGCIIAMRKSGKDLCAFCRMAPVFSDEKRIKSITKLTENGNAEAFNQLGGHYDEGAMGLSQDQQKANELFLKAGELGCADGYFNLGSSYASGSGVNVDKKKAQHFYELAAMGGSIEARYNLGCTEKQSGNYERAMKHFIIAASAGYKCVDVVKLGFMAGIVTKDEYANTLRSYQKSINEMKSDMRDQAAKTN